MSPETIRAIIEERDTLREELRQLKQVIRDTVNPFAWRFKRAANLTASQARIVCALYAAYPEGVTRERLMLVRLVVEPEADPKTIDVMVSQTRSRFRAAGFAGASIVCVWAEGYRLTTEARQWLDAQLKEQLNVPNA